MHASQELDSHSQPNPQEEAHVLGEDDEQEEPVQQMHEEIQQNDCDEEGDDLDEDRIEKEEVDQIRTEESKQEEEEEPENEMLVDSEYINIPTVKY